ncbi:hypothetical protein [Altibacter sp. HG106]|uniref:hypothetical protein n=1 Tax=Altibacter sp. HG106 TaxID=3023937 RepID=UPI0023509B4A|nr:hypothetical protein [Altibacter sp. HG106]MDC7995651.1 hypothetical protein [Altibacter sp. HG106]
MIKRTFFIISAVMLLVYACGSDDDVDCTTALPAPNFFLLGFFTTEGTPLLGNVYDQEAFRVFNTDTTFLIPYQPGSYPNRLAVRFPAIQNDTEYFIELSEKDTDTLQFRYETMQGPCFPNYTLQQVTYNGTTIALETSGEVDLIKE